MVDYITTSAPSNPTAEETWLNPDDDVIRIYTGSEWVKNVQRFAGIKRNANGVVQWESGGSAVSGSWAGQTAAGTKKTTFATPILGIENATLTVSATAGTAKATAKILTPGGGTITTMSTQATAGGTSTTTPTPNSLFYSQISTLTFSIVATTGSPDKITVKFANQPQTWAG